MKKQFATQARVAEVHRKTKETNVRVVLNLDGKVFLLLTNEGNLIVLPADAKEFAPLAQYSVAKSATWAHPAVFGNRILIKDETTLRSLTIL